ncbi:hypothetical protein GC194_13075 [bacterium]|nr:hypothetical protein [bacterium]
MSKVIRYRCVLFTLFLFVISACTPVLYQPNTVNVPTVDSAKNKEIKATADFRVVDLQSNYLSRKSGLFYQASFNMRWGALRSFSGQQISNTGPRVALGLGKMWLAHPHKTFVALQLAHSNLRHYQDYSGSILDFFVLMRNGM